LTTFRIFIAATIILLSEPGICHSQDKGILSDNIAIGITLSPYGQCNGVTFGNSDGDPIYSDGTLYSFGLAGYFRLYGALMLETGLIYSRNQISVKEYYYPSATENITLYSIPINLAIASRYFFITNGITIDFEENNSGALSNQSGIGFNLGLGGKYDFNSRISISLGLYGQVHGITPFKPDKSPYANPRGCLIGYEIRTGLRYQLNK